MITRQADYALRMVVFMAAHKDEKLTTDYIAYKANIPRSFLPRIIASLAAKKLILTYRGKSGGVKLARDPSEISVFDVIEAIDGHVIINACLVDKDVCIFTGTCKLRDFWLDLQETLVNRLKTTKISDLIVDYDVDKIKGD